MMSTDEIMSLDSHLAAVLESLQFALKAGTNATDPENPVDAAGGAFLDPLDESPIACYPYAWGIAQVTLEHSIQQLQYIRSSLTV